MLTPLFLFGQSAGIDGGLIRNLEEASALTRRGHRAYILISGNPSFSDYDDLIRSWHFKGENRISWHLNNSISLMAHISRILKSTKADLLHVQVPTPLTRGLTAALLKRIAKIPVVIDVHDLWSDPSIANLPHQYVSERAMKVICKMADAIITASSRVSSLLQSFGFDGVFLVPNGVNTEEFNPKVNATSIRLKFGWDREKQIVVYVGAISEQSGLENLVHAARILRKTGHSNLRFLIVGDGPSRAKLQAIVNSAGLNEQWVFSGAVPHKLVPLYISSADICVAPYVDIPSIRAGSSMKAPEYLACGKPLVFSGIDPTIAESGACIQVPSGNGHALSAAIGTLLGDPQLRIAMGERGWNYVSHKLSWDVLAKTIEKAYAQALE